MWMCSLYWLPVAQNHNFGQILTFGRGGSCTDPVLPMRSKFSAACARADPWCTLRAKFRLDRFILSPSGSDKTLIFFVFWTSAFCGVANCRQSDKVEYGCTTTNQGIKIVYAFMAKSGAQTLTFKSVKNKHTQKLNIFGRSGGRWIPVPTKLGIGECVIEHVEYIPTTPKLSWVRHIVLPRGHWKFGGNQVPSN